MYRVAVIQNENEMLRSGYTNVIPKLKSIKRLSQYSFELFNVVNIHDLFHNGDRHLNDFDSILITTNSTSEPVLKVLRDNAEAIISFIASGKGIFISSQKKLSVRSLDPSVSDGLTLFMPDPYDYFTVSRPSNEKDSGVGEISVYEDLNHLLLQYPTKVTAQLTMNHCEQNEFKRHYYRSHIIPKSNGAFCPVFVDTSYSDVSSRSLIMVNLVPQNGERIVISTIAIDWEFHENLLTNIVTYITEGLPKVAFIDSSTKRYGDFDFLLTSAKLSKISHEIYFGIDEIKKELCFTHNTYVFSPYWKEKEIVNFFNTLNEIRIPNGVERSPYVRVYYFKEVDTILTLTQYSNFSTIDLIIDSSILWINSRFNNRMWNNSFWATYDVLVTLHENSVNIENFIPSILNDIRKHYTDYSYDGVMGATCGLFELMFLCYKHYTHQFIAQGFTKDDIVMVLNWIVDKFETQSTYDKQTVLLLFTKYYTDIFYDKEFAFDKKYYEIIISSVSSCSNLLSNISSDTASEIDLCRNIGLYIIFEQRESEINELLSILHERQLSSGKWTNVGRTAHVLVFLLENYSTLSVIQGLTTSIDDMVYNGVLFLRSQYKWINANWNDDIQATAKAIQAIGLYNRRYRYVTQDFFKTLEIESDKLYSSTVIHNVSETVRKLRKQLNETTISYEKAQLENNQKNSILQKQNRKLELSDQYENKMMKQLVKSRTATVVFSSLLITFVFYLTILYPTRVLQEVRSLDFKGIILGFIVALVLTNYAQRTMDKSEFLTRKQRKKSK